MSLDCCGLFLDYRWQLFTWRRGFWDGWGSPCNAAKVGFYFLFCFAGFFPPQCWSSIHVIKIRLTLLISKEILVIPVNLCIVRLNIHILLKLLEISDSSLLQWVHCVHTFVWIIVNGILEFGAIKMQRIFAKLACIFRNLFKCFLISSVCFMFKIWTIYPDITSHPFQGWGVSSETQKPISVMYIVSQTSVYSYIYCLNKLIPFMIYSSYKQAFPHKLLFCLLSMFITPKNCGLKKCSCDSIVGKRLYGECCS